MVEQVIRVIAMNKGQLGDAEHVEWQPRRLRLEHIEEWRPAPRLSALKHLVVLKFEFGARVQSNHIGNKLRLLRYRRTLHQQALQLHRLGRHRQTQKARS